MCFALVFVFREGHGVSLSGNTKNPPGLVPVSPALGEPALAGVWTGWSPEVSSTLTILWSCISWKEIADHSITSTNGFQDPTDRTWVRIPLIFAGRCPDPVPCSLGSPTRAQPKGGWHLPGPARRSGAADPRTRRRAAGGAQRGCRAERGSQSPQRAGRGGAGAGAGAEAEAARPPGPWPPPACPPGQWERRLLAGRAVAALPQQRRSETEPSPRRRSGRAMEGLEGERQRRGRGNRRAAGGRPGPGGSFVLRPGRARAVAAVGAGPGRRLARSRSPRGRQWWRRRGWGGRAPPEGQRAGAGGGGRSGLPALCLPPLRSAAAPPAPPCGGRAPSPLAGALRAGLGWVRRSVRASLPGARGCFSFS